MSVVADRISIVASRSIVEERYPGGHEAFGLWASRGLYCSDEVLVRVGFDRPGEARLAVDHLQQNGLTYTRDRVYVDFAVVVHGLCAVGCDWLNSGTLDGIPRCWHVDGDPEDLATPVGWSLEDAQRWDEATAKDWYRFIQGTSDPGESPFGEGTSVLNPLPFPNNREVGRLDLMAHELRESRRYEEAHQLWAQAFSLDPWDEGLCLSASVSAVDMGVPVAGLRIIDTFLESSPPTQKVLANQGGILRAVGALQAASAALEEALTLDRDDPVVWWQRAQVEDEMQRTEDAETSYQEVQRLVAQDPAWEEILGFIERRRQKGAVAFWVRRAEELERSNDMGRALEMWLRATEAEPDEAELWYGAGVIQLNLRHEAEAVESFGRACDLAPELEVAWANKAAALFGLGRNVEAVEAATVALSLDPDDTLAWIHKAQAEESLHRRQDASGSWASAVRLLEGTPLQTEVLRHAKDRLAALSGSA